MSINPFLKRISKGCKSRFDTDTELAAVVNSVDRYYSLKELRRLLVEKFGAARVPSVSALHRYIQRITWEAKCA
jgi:hypothetical protein